MPLELANRLLADEISLFIDADGTMLDIAPRPEQAKASPSLLGTLESVYHALGGALAVVTGRTIEEVDRLFAPLILPASGIHGAELRHAPGAPIVDAGGPDIPAELRRSVGVAVARHPGAFVEDKGKALAVHWRAAVEREAGIWADLTAALEAAQTPELTIMRGHCVFEVKAAATNKGDAVRAFMNIDPYAGRTPVFIGDDVTDIAGFAAVAEFGGHAFSVGRPLDGAMQAFAGPPDVRAWLDRLARSGGKACSA